MMIRVAAQVPDPSGSALAGLPFAVLSLLPLVWTGQSAVLFGLCAALIGMFSLCLPLMAAVSGGLSRPDDDLPLSKRSYSALLAAWSVMDLFGAFLADRF